MSEPLIRCEGRSKLTLGKHKWSWDKVCLYCGRSREGIERERQFIRARKVKKGSVQRARAALATKEGQP
jgi:hypothetical protein